MWKTLLLFCHLVGLFSVIHASCELQPIIGDDAAFCNGDLRVVYPDLGDISCKRVTLCQNVTKDLNSAPVVTFSKAQKDKDYFLMMVDPDAPSRDNPIRKFWLHWMIGGVKGQDLLGRKSLEGRQIQDYNPPAPPANTRYHRYQFLVYEQPPGSSPDLQPSEKTIRSNFDLDAFTTRFGLGKPVATTQFMAQNLQQRDL